MLMQESEIDTVERENGPQKGKKVDGDLKEKSAYKGVFKCGKKFKAQIQTNRVQHYLGLYDTEIEAAQAYDNHARVVLGPRARTNFDYSNIPQTSPSVLVAPIFTRAEPKTAQTPGEEGEEPAAAAPKRTYVGIKLKRQALSGMPGLHRTEDNNEKRQKTGSADHSTYYGQSSGSTSMPAYPSFNSTSSGHQAFSNRDFGHMLHMNSSAGFPASHGGAMMMPAVPPAGASTEEQRRWFEQFRLLQQLMQTPQSSYFLNQQNPQQPQGFSASAAGAYNPYAVTMPFASGLGQDASSFGMMQSGKYPGMPYGPYASQQFPQYPGMMGQFPPQSGGQFSMHPAGPVDLSGMLLSASVQAGSSGGGGGGGGGGAWGGGTSASAAAMAQVMSQASTVASTAAQSGQASRSVHSSNSEGRSRLSSAHSSVDGDVSGNLHTLSEAVSSLPHSTAASPQGFDASFAPFSRSRSNTVNSGGEGSGGGGGGSASGAGMPALVTPMNDRTADLLAAASAMIGSGVNTPRSPAGQRAGNEGDTEADEDEAESDWRDQLYYWTGELQFDAARLQQVWKGSWVGSYTGKPTAAEFAQSSNHFEYCLPVRSAKQILRKDGGLIPQSGRWEGFYLMDNTGNGALERYEDTEYEVLFDSADGSAGGSAGSTGGDVYCPVFGRGDSDFGAFVVTGVYNRRTRVLEMTRQYVSDTDPRAALTLEAFVALCRASMASWR